MEMDSDGSSVAFGGWASWPCEEGAEVLPMAGPGAVFDLHPLLLSMVRRFLHVSVSPCFSLTLRLDSLIPQRVGGDSYLGNPGFL